MHCSYFNLKFISYFLLLSNYNLAIDYLTVSIPSKTCMQRKNIKDVSYDRMMPYSFNTIRVFVQHRLSLVCTIQLIYLLLMIDKCVSLILNVKVTLYAVYTMVMLLKLLLIIVVLAMDNFGLLSSKLQR